MRPITGRPLSHWTTAWARKDCRAWHRWGSVPGRSLGPRSQDQLSLGEALTML